MLRFRKIDMDERTIYDMNDMRRRLQAIVHQMVEVRNDLGFEIWL